MNNCDGVREFLLENLMKDIKAQEKGRYLEIGEARSNLPNWGECETENEQEGERLGIAIEFWGRWTDAKNHDWAYYPGVEREDWPIIARQICQGIVEQWEPDRMMDNFVFQPPPAPPRIPLWHRIKGIFSGHASPGG